MVPAAPTQPSAAPTLPQAAFIQIGRAPSIKKSADAFDAALGLLGDALCAPAVMITQSGGETPCGSTRRSRAPPSLGGARYALHARGRRAGRARRRSLWRRGTPTPPCAVGRARRPGPSRHRSDGGRRARIERRGSARRETQSARDSDSQDGGAYSTNRRYRASSSRRPPPLPLPPPLHELLLLRVELVEQRPGHARHGRPPRPPLGHVDALRRRPRRRLPGEARRALGPRRVAEGRTTRPRASRARRRAPSTRRPAAAPYDDRRRRLLLTHAHLREGAPVHIVWKTPRGACAPARRAARRAARPGPPG